MGCKGLHITRACFPDELSIIIIFADYCSSAQCSDLCVNEGGNASCLCRDGYKLNTDGVSCSGMYLIYMYLQPTCEEWTFPSLKFG